MSGSAFLSQTNAHRSRGTASRSATSRSAPRTLLLCIAADEDDDGNGGEQDRPTPDYERQEQQTYRGSFPRQGGGRTQPRGQQDGHQQRQDGPRAPQRRQQGQQVQPQRQQRQEPLPVDFEGDGNDPPFVDDPLPDFGLPQFQNAGGVTVDTGTGEVISPWGSDLTAGELKMAKQRATVAGLDDAGVLKLCGRITTANVSEALAKLKTAAEASLKD